MYVAIYTQHISGYIVPSIITFTYMYVNKKWWLADMYYCQCMYMYVHGMYTGMLTWVKPCIYQGPGLHKLDHVHTYLTDVHTCLYQYICTCIQWLEVYLGQHVYIFSELYVHHNVAGYTRTLAFKFRLGVTSQVSSSRKVLCTCLNHVYGASVYTIRVMIA